MWLFQWRFSQSILKLGEVEVPGPEIPWDHELIITVSANVVALMVLGHHHYAIDGLVQERRNSIANTRELCLSCSKPLLWCSNVTFFMFCVTKFVCTKSFALDIMCSDWWYTAINSLRPSDAIWRHRSGSTLAQVMACCLMAPSHYPNQCWLIISKV